MTSKTTLSGEDLWKKMKQEKAITLSEVKITPFDPTLNGTGGGRWLGCAREWMQRKFINGEHVTWGSYDRLKAKGELTVNDIEHLASLIAAEAVRDFINNIEVQGYTPHKLFK